MAAQQVGRSGAELLPTEPIEVEGAVHAGVSGARSRVWTRNDSLEQEDATNHGQNPHKVVEELAQHQGHLSIEPTRLPSTAG